MLLQDQLVCYTMTFTKSLLSKSALVQNPLLPEGQSQHISELLSSDETAWWELKGHFSFCTAEMWRCTHCLSARHFGFHLSIHKSSTHAPHLIWNWVTLAAGLGDLTLRHTVASPQGPHRFTSTDEIILLAQHLDMPGTPPAAGTWKVSVSKTTLSDFFWERRNSSNFKLPGCLRSMLNVQRQSLYHPKLLVIEVTSAGTSHWRESNPICSSTLGPWLTRSSWLHTGDHTRTCWRLQFVTNKTSSVKSWEAIPQNRKPLTCN